MIEQIESYKYRKGQLVKIIKKRDGSFYESCIPTDETFKEVHPEDYDLHWLKLKKWPSLPNPIKELNLVDLFSGTGPMSLGVVEAGRSLGIKVNPIYALDFEKTAANNYKVNFPDCDVVTDDINNVIDGELGFCPSDKEKDLLKKLGDVDIVIGGPPCQGHSDLNNHTRRDDPRNQLILKVIRFVELFNPEYVIIENVQGIRHDKHNILGVAEDYLKKLGYNLYENLLMASKYGVAQNRRRFILVGSKSEIDFNLDRYERKDVNSTLWAIRDLLEIKAGKEDVYDTPAATSKVNQGRIDYLFEHNLYELPNELRPKCQQSASNRYTSVYSRMYPDKPSPTITSGFGSIGQGRFGHPLLRRTITPHEAARIQFIPDFFIFPSIKREAIQKMIGNAVPPKLTYIIGLELLR